VSNENAGLLGLSPEARDLSELIGERAEKLPPQELAEVLIKWLAYVAVTAKIFTTSYGKMPEKTEEENQ
jgi:hypothetical protein